MYIVSVLCLVGVLVCFFHASYMSWKTRREAKLYLRNEALTKAVVDEWMQRPEVKELKKTDYEKWHKEYVERVQYINYRLYKK